jgi:hypothetical protein
MGHRLPTFYLDYVVESKGEIVKHNRRKFFDPLFSVVPG